MKVTMRGVFLFVAGIFVLLAPRWMPDEPLWKRAAIMLLGVALLAFAVWQSKQPSGSASGTGIVRGYRIARAGISGVFSLIAPFDMTDEPFWKRAGMFGLGVALLAFTAWLGRAGKR